MPHVDIELEDNKQFISNIPRIMALSEVHDFLSQNIRNEAIFFSVKVLHALQKKKKRKKQQRTVLNIFFQKTGFYI